MEQLLKLEWRVWGVLVLQAFINCCLVSIIINKELFEDSIIMEHLDPSIIIEKEFPLKTLCIFVGASLLWNSVLFIVVNDALRKQQQSRSAETAGVCSISTIAVYSTLILCGVDPRICPRHTLLTAFYLSFNTAMPAVFFRQARKQTLQQRGNKILVQDLVIMKPKEMALYILGPVEKTKDQNIRTLQSIHQFATLFSFIGVVCCSILRVLDHGMQVQRFPLPLIYGFTYGRCIGNVFGVLWSLCLR